MDRSRQVPADIRLKNARVRLDAVIETQEDSFAHIVADFIHSWVDQLEVDRGAAEQMLKQLQHLKSTIWAIAARALVTSIVVIDSVYVPALADEPHISRPQ